MPVKTPAIHEASSYLPDNTICVSYCVTVILTETTDSRLTLMEKTDPSSTSDGTYLLVSQHLQGWG